MKARIANFIDLSFAETDSLGASLFFQGCSFGCPKCHNPEMQSFSGGYEVETSAINNHIRKRSGWYNSFTFLGGEPLLQQDALLEIAECCRELGIEVWIYTGFNADEIPDKVLEVADVIVAGRYVDELNTGGFPASSNQVIIDRRNKNVRTG